MKRNLAIFISGLLWATPALAQTDDSIWYMHHGWWIPMMGWGLFGGLGSLFFWIALIVLIIVLVRRPPHNRNDPLDILKERFARGEISKEEYEERRKILSS